MEKLVKEDRTSFEISSGVSIEEFNDKYYKLLKDVKDKYGYITDIKIHCDSGEYNDGEDHYEDIEICFKRHETDEEFKRRKDWYELAKNKQKENEIRLMKEYIQSHKNEALEFINSLNKN